MTDTVTGSCGEAQRIPRERYSDAPATVDAWIITAPAFHLFWSQYLLAVVTLADVPGVKAATKRDSAMTHELLVVALNPEHGPYNADSLTELHYLTPVNVAEQFTATDEQASHLAGLAARAVVDGLLIPETGDAPERIRAAWRTSIAQTLDHDRDPHHGAAN